MYSTGSTTISTLTVSTFSSPLHAFRLTMRLLFWPSPLYKKNGDLELYYEKTPKTSPSFVVIQQMMISSVKLET
jgi:hypothetical protein